MTEPDHDEGSRPAAPNEQRRRGAAARPPSTRARAIASPIAKGQSGGFYETQVGCSYAVAVLGPSEVRGLERARLRTLRTQIDVPVRNGYSTRAGVSKPLTPNEFGEQIRLSAEPFVANQLTSGARSSISEMDGWARPLALTTSLRARVGGCVQLAPRCLPSLV